MPEQVGIPAIIRDPQTATPLQAVASLSPPIHLSSRCTTKSAASTSPIECPSTTHSLFSPQFEQPFVSPQPLTWTSCHPSLEAKMQKTSQDNDSNDFECANQSQSKQGRRRNQFRRLTSPKCLSPDMEPQSTSTATCSPSPSPVMVRQNTTNVLNSTSNGRTVRPSTPISFPATSIWKPSAICTTQSAPRATLPLLAGALTDSHLTFSAPESVEFTPVGNLTQSSLGTEEPFQSSRLDPPEVATSLRSSQPQVRIPQSPVSYYVSHQPPSQSSTIDYRPLQQLRSSCVEYVQGQTKFGYNGLTTSTLRDARHQGCLTENGSTPRKKVGLAMKQRSDNFHINPTNTPPKYSRNNQSRTTKQRQEYDSIAASNVLDEVKIIVNKYEALLAAERQEHALVVLAKDEVRNAKRHFFQRIHEEENPIY